MWMRKHQMEPRRLDGAVARVGSRRDDRIASNGKEMA